MSKSKKNGAKGNNKGRPKGSSNVSIVVPAPLSRCTKCQSTERTDYAGKVEHAYRGVTSDGYQYTHIVRRRTRCKNCGQVRIDRSFEFRGEK